MEWNLFDFIAAALLLLGTGVVIMLSFRKLHTTKNRAIAVAIALLVFGLIYIQLAVNLFGPG